MSYEFPHITNIQQVLDAIKGREEFVVKVDEENDYTVVNYLVNFEGTFPPVIDEQTAILRECRGITFRTSTGEVIARKYHKFFNLGEKTETLPQNIDWSRPYRRFKKLDGSMITPMLMKDGTVRFCTKMGLTGVAAPVDEWAADKPQYHELCLDSMNSGSTPIFEWCSRIQRIVIDYAVTDLVLTAVRDNVTGDYMGAEELRALGDMYGITVAPFGEVLTGYDQAVVDEVRACEGEEGDIFRFDDGHMIKLKGEWYCQLHKTLEHLNLEKDVIRLILDEKLDDAKAFLPEDLVKAAEDFAQTIFHNLRQLGSRIYWEVQADHDNMNGGKKQFAQKVTQLKDGLQPFRFKTWDQLEEGEEGAYHLLVNHVKNQLGSQGKVDGARFLWGGARWSDFRDGNLSE